MKALNFIVPLVVYPFDVMVSLGETDKELKLSLSQYEGWSKIRIERQFHMEKGRCIFFPSKQTLIRLYDYPVTPDDYGFLQHEIFHAVDMILECVGLKLCAQSCEAYAYLTGYLTTEIYKRIRL